MISPDVLKSVFGISPEGIKSEIGKREALNHIATSIFVAGLFLNLPLARNMLTNPNPDVSHVGIGLLSLAPLIVAPVFTRINSARMRRLERQLTYLPKPEPRSESKNYWEIVVKTPDGYRYVDEQSDVIQPESGSRGDYG